MHLLVIEDEKKIADSLKKGFCAEGFVVDVAYDGAEGYDLALSEDYDVIVLDLMLPSMDGMEICKTLRTENVQTPIIMLTARGEIEDRVEGLNLGADDYLSKPFSFEELLARVRALSRRPKESVGTVLTVGELVLDTVKMEVKKGGRKIKLSRKEFALLEYLMRNKGRVVTRGQIIRGVWDFDSNILPNTVEAFVRNLRRKVGKKTIITVRGFGYKMSS